MVAFMEAVVNLVVPVLLITSANVGLVTSAAGSSIVTLLEHKVLPSELASFGVMQADQISLVSVSVDDKILYLGAELL